jgi:hypothetical protein
MRIKVSGFIKWLKLNIKYTLKKSFFWTSTTIAAFQVLGFLCDFNNIFPENLEFIKRLLISVGVVIALWLSIFTICCIYIRKKKSVIVLDAGNEHCVYVEYGDLFEQRQTESIVVVTANRCFDTIVDNDLISGGTIHGMAVNEIIANGCSQEKLNAALQNDLREKGNKPEVIIDRSQKRKGNLERYPVGSIAEFKQNKVIYFFLGMSAFDSKLHPNTTDEEYALTMQRLIQYCRDRSQRQPIYMPIIGTSGRDNKKSERMLLEYMVKTIQMNDNLINADIHIVIYHTRRSDISIQGLGG